MKKVVKFGAEWCPSCVELEEKLKSVSTQVPIVSLDYDEHTKVFGQYNIREIPTMLMFEDNVEIKKMTGSNHTQEQLTDWFNT